MKKVILAISILLLLAMIFLNTNSSGRSIRLSLDSIADAPSEEIDIIKESRKLAARELLEFDYMGYSIPFDLNENKYYFPACTDDISIKIESSYSSIKAYSDDANYHEIIVYNENTYKTYKIEYTGLSIMDIEIPLADNSTFPIPWNYSKGFMTLFSYDENTSTIDVKISKSKMKIRGGASTHYDKKSYSIKFIDLVSEKATVTDVPGFEPNSRFALNSLFEDDTKIRDTLALKLWQEIGAGKNEYGVDSSINIIYAETFINSHYWGLYGLHEVINEYSLNSGPDDIIYKVISYIYPSFEDFKSNGIIPSLEITYNKHSVEDARSIFADYFELLFFADDDTFKDNIDEYIDFENCINYYIFTELLYAADNNWKNVIYTYKASDDKFLLTPWDVDISFGSMWNESYIFYIEYSLKYATDILNDDEFGTASLMPKLWRNDVNGFREKVANRWFELRKNELSEENLLAQVDGLYDLLTESGARQRDARRWPNGPSSQDNSFIQEFIKTRLVFLDDFYSQYTG